MAERWRVIQEKGFEGLYEVSDLGRVRNIKSGRILKPGRRGDGYLFVSLFHNGKCKEKAIHRLIAESFIPNTENKPCIDHIDGNPLNNDMSNLRWCTQKENLNNPIYKERTRAAHLGNIPANSKMVELRTKDGDLICYFTSLRQAEMLTGIDKRNILKGYEFKGLIIKTTNNG